jgi:hypothetical protein
VAVAQTRADLLDGGGHDREIGLPLLRERRRQRDQDRVGVSELVVIGRGPDAALAHEWRELGRGNIGDVALAAVEGGDQVGGDVDQEHRPSGGGERLRERDADVAGADHGRIPSPRLPVVFGLRLECLFEHGATG